MYFDRITFPSRKLSLESPLPTNTTLHYFDCIRRRLKESFADKDLQRNKFYDDAKEFAKSLRIFMV